MAVFDLEDGEQADIGGFLIKRKGNRIQTDRTAVYPSIKGAHLVSETPELTNGCRIEVLADKNLIEVYINDGEYVISNAVYGIGDFIKVNIEKTVHLYTLKEHDERTRGEE
ncbi:GH32 C-terminal domain-containing protein [Drancourtella sp. An12]